MTVKECYSQMGGDYNNVLSRFYDEAMIKRLLGRFIDHTSFRALEQAMTEGDTQAAFNAAHTLRGVCQSLSFTQLCGTWIPSPRRCGAAISLLPQPTWTRQSGSMT